MTWVVRAPDQKLAKHDKRLYTRVRRVLWDYEPLRASHAEIFIDVEDQAVRLRGRVRTLPQKILAEVLSRRLPEVASVTNELIADPEVVRAVADALGQDERTAPYVIRIDSRHGVVSLHGEVPSEAVQQAAIDVASRVPLVGTVRNLLVISGAPLPAMALARPSAAVDEVSPASQAVRTEGAPAPVVRS